MSHVKIVPTASIIFKLVLHWWLRLVVKLTSSRDVNEVQQVAGSTAADVPKLEQPPVTDGALQVAGVSDVLTWAQKGAFCSSKPPTKPPP